MVARLQSHEFALHNELFQDPGDLCIYRSASRLKHQMDLTCRVSVTTDRESWIHESCNFQHLQSALLLHTAAYSEEIVDGVNQLLVFTEEIKSNLALDLVLRKASKAHYSLQEVATLLANCLEALWLMTQTPPYCHGHFTPSSVYSTASGWKLGYFHSQMWRNSSDPHYPEYKHPAVRKGQETEGGWADLFALGVLLSHVCTLSEPEVFKHVELLDCQRAYIALQTAIAEKYPGSVVRVVSSLLAVSRKFTLSQVYDQLAGKMAAVWTDLGSVHSIPVPSLLQPSNAPSPPDSQPSRAVNSLEYAEQYVASPSLQLTCPYCLQTQTRPNRPALSGFLCTSCRHFSPLPNPSDSYPAPTLLVRELTL